MSDLGCQLSTAGVAKGSPTRSRFHSSRGSKRIPFKTAHHGFAIAANWVSRKNDSGVTVVASHQCQQRELSSSRSVYDFWRLLSLAGQRAGDLTPSVRPSFIG